MNALFYINWRSFTGGKTTDNPLQKTLLFLTLEVILLLMTTLLLGERLTGLSIRQHLPNPRSSDALERSVAILGVLGFFYLIFKGLQGYFIKSGRYRQIIKDYNQKYRHEKAYWFSLLSMGIFFLSAFLLWFTGYYLSKHI